MARGIAGGVAGSSDAPLTTHHAHHSPRTPHHTHHTTGREASLAVASALKNNVMITKLDLADNAFFKEGGAALAEAIKLMPNLRHLSLRS